MTSKELNEILNKTRRTPNISLTPEQVEELIKDLEVLEIFKERLHINIYIGYFNDKPMYFLKIMGCDIFITKEIYNKLKEWFE